VIRQRPARCGGRRHRPAALGLFWPAFRGTEEIPRYRPSAGDVMGQQPTVCADTVFA